MTPDEFTRKEDFKAILELREKLSELMDGKETYICISSMFDLLVALIELTVIDKVTIYKHMIETMLDLAKKHKVKKHKVKK